ncbi:hypothetical protein F4780DRAFT_768539 [Xylariomycetidae sp. FL0641]|nr:hypothetical protein F4780DRAFT_768539 [Xylariomycetidae sp. FL0641]
MATYYEQRMLNLYDRWGISRNAQCMLRVYEDYQTSKVDAEHIGRLVRMSDKNRNALTNTMMKCARVMKDHPSETKHAFTMIMSCCEMIKFADQKPSPVGFPGFLKLPREIRYRVHKFYLTMNTTTSEVVPWSKKSSCVCANDSSRRPKVDMSLAFTCKGISHEVLSTFYRRFMVKFPCACEMGHQLARNVRMRKAISKIAFHWCGPTCDRNILQLQKLRALQDLWVYISRDTTKHYNERALEVRKYFTYKRSQDMLPDALGFDELLSLRGLRVVVVDHLPKTKADQRSNSEKASLQSMLEETVKKSPENGAENVEEEDYDDHLW